MYGRLTIAIPRLHYVHRAVKIELDPISTEERLRQVFAVYVCNETEFSYVDNNGILQRQNGETATEWRIAGQIPTFKFKVPT